MVRRASDLEPQADVPAPLPMQRAGRLASLDALRGLNMFWIVGMDELVPRLSQMDWARGQSSLASPVRFAATQLTHADWTGLRLEDTIFPLFVFIVGVSLVFSLGKTLAAHGRGYAVARILSRSAVLYLLGLLVYHGFDQPIHAFPGQTAGHHAVRWLGVLQRIAIAYAAAGLLFCFLRLRGMVLVAVAILLGYWLLMRFVDVPGVGRGSYAEGRNLANYLDQRYLGGFKWDGDHDPEGLLSTLPAVASCLLGVFAGRVLRHPTLGPYAKVGVLLAGGAALAAAGWAWGFVPSPVQFPVIKKLWTSSFVLLVGGYSAALLGAFYLVIDVWRLRAWATPFVWIGTNAIAIYMLAQLGFVGRVAELLVGGGRHHNAIFGSAQEAVTLAVSLMLMFAVARFLYVRQVFIRV